VWFGSGNELSPPGVSAEHQNVYNAVRGAGNNTIIMLCEPGGGGPGTLPDNASAYTSMSNVVWDQHWYDWMTNGSTDAGTLSSDLIGMVQQDQSFTTSSNGTIPVIGGDNTLTSPWGQIVASYIDQ
jgi:hypothetical protein